MAIKGKKKGRLSVDFSGVKSGGGRAVPDDKYHARVEEVAQEEGKDSGQPYLAFQWKIMSKGGAKGAIVYDNISLQPQALWRFKTLLEVLGQEVEDGVMDIDFSDLVGQECTIEVTNERYNDKEKPRITAFESLEAGTEAEEAEETEKEEEEKSDTPKKSTSKVKVGMKVKFTDDDEKTIKGKITSIDGDTAQIEDSSGDEWEVEVSDLTAV